MAFLLGIVIVAVRNPLLQLFLGIIDPAEVTDAASMYFRICVWGIPPLLVTLSINGWFIGMQDTVRPMAISVAMNILNISASIIAVYVFNAGFAGVAFGTLAANWTGLFLAIGIVASYSRKVPLTPDFRQIIKGGGFGKFFRVSSDLFLRSACIMGVSLSVTAIRARMGDMTMAVNTVMLPFFCSSHISWTAFHSPARAYRQKRRSTRFQFITSCRKASASLVGIYGYGISDCLHIRLVIDNGHDY